MMNIDLLKDYANGIFIIPTWEMFFYVSVISLYALLGKPASCLINSFAFSFYWGFMYLLPKISFADALLQSSLMIYLISGLGIYALATFTFLRTDVKKRSGPTGSSYQTS